MRKLIITGAGGQLGSCLLRKFIGDEAFEVCGFTREELDILDEKGIAEVVDRQKPFAVINCAAYTAVDRAESEQEKTRNINVTGVQNLAKVCEEREVMLIHISTDYVFSGEDGGTDVCPYKAQDEVDPRNVYGSTKAEGEKAMLETMQRVQHYVVRVGWLYDFEGANFFNTMKRLGSEEGADLRIVEDQIGTPTWTGSLSEVLKALLESNLDSGIYHYSDNGMASWKSFADEIFKLLHLTPKVTGVKTEEYLTDAQRPQNSILEGLSFLQALGLERKHWKQSLENCVDEMNLWEEVLRKAEVWAQEPFDRETRETVQGWLDVGDREALIDAFYKDMEFGTGGMRGKCGPGTNRINAVTISKATQGLANYLRSHSEGMEKLKVAIAYDSRIQSPSFSRVVAEVLSGNDIKVLLYPALRPTPQLSFTIIDQGCDAGIVITASHNPPEYNGFKVYFRDGAQVTAPHDESIIFEVRKIDSLDDVKFDLSGRNIIELGVESDEAYLDKVLSLRRSNSLSDGGSDVCLVFTALHGTGAVSVPQALKKFGFNNVHEVEAQNIPNGYFPTVKSPNPEEAEALSEAVKLAESIGAELVMGTDPDSDRVGLAVPNDKGQMVLLNGNETGALLFDYVLRNGRANGDAFDSSNFIASTVVTSPLLKKIGDGYGVGHKETLTGFKNIAAAINSEKRTYVVGGEESYGYLIGDVAMDKDGVSSCCVLAELAHELKLAGSSMLQRLEEIHRRFSVFEEGLVSVVKEGLDGAAVIGQLMATYRNNAPSEICGEKVVEIRDFNDGSLTDFPKSNVIQFITDKGSRITVRPSGTEPKIKYYVSVQHKMNESEDYSEVRKSLKQKVKELFADFGV